jgi:hypothetical protein
LNSKIEITEIDLFTFALFRDELNKEKKEYIEENIGMFQEQIELIKQSQSPLKDELKEDAISKISLPPIRKEVIVFPLIYEITVPEEATLTLAAKSTDAEIKPLTRTFIDKQKSFLLKLIHEKGITKIFLFDSEGRSIEKYKLVIHPANKEIISTDNISIMEKELVDIETISVLI